MHPQFAQRIAEVNEAKLTIWLDVDRQANAAEVNGLPDRFSMRKIEKNTYLEWFRHKTWCQEFPEVCNNLSGLGESELEFTSL